MTTIRRPQTSLRVILAVLALGCLLVGVTSARASVQDVMTDYDDNNGVITRCHDREDLIAARRVDVAEGYGDPQGAIDAALARPELVGTPERPCPPATDTEAAGGGGWGGRHLGVVIGLQGIVLGAVLWLRRRRLRRFASAGGRRLRGVPGSAWGVLAVSVATAAIVVGAATLRGPPAPTVTVIERPVHAPTAAMQDDRLVTEPPQPPRSGAFIRSRMQAMAGLGARTVRVDLRWDVVATSAPIVAGTDPDDPSYDWTTYDRIVSEAARAGLRVFFTVWGTPEWAADPAVPAIATDPAWGNVRPRDPAEFGAFATAAVSRYSPRGVRSWEVWNEPNMNMFLRPQYERRGEEWVAVAPETYAALLAAFARGAGAADPDARIVLGGLAPVGDPCGTACRVGDGTPARLGPGQFLRAFAALPEHALIDVVAIHPYPSGPPPRPGDPPRTRKIDVDNLADLQAALRGTPLVDLPVWLTEYGWQTEGTPAMRYAVTPAEQADRVAGALALFNRFPRVELASYYFLQDNGAFNSGLFANAENDALTAPKPATAAHALPLARAGGEDDNVHLVGQVRPARGPVTVVLEREVDGGWREMATVPTRADGTFAVAIDPRGHDVTIRTRWTDASGADRTGHPVHVEG